MARTPASSAATTTAAPATPVLRLWLNAFLGYTAIGASIQVMPDLVRTRFDGGPFEAGTVVTLGFLATMLSRPIAGRISDRRSPRGVIIVGSSLAAFAALLHLAAGSLPLLVAARLLLGLGEGALFTASIGWVLSDSPPGRRGAVSGRFGLSMWGGLSIGPILGALLQSAFGFVTVWLAAAAMPFIGMLLIVSVPRRGGPRIKRPSASRMLPHTAWGPASSYAFASIGYGIIASSLVGRLGELRIAHSELGLAMFGTIFLATRLSGSQLVDRLGYRMVLVAALATEAGGLVGLSLMRSSMAGVLSIALAAIGLALVYPCYVAWVTERTEVQERATALGMVISAWDLGVAVGGPLTGVLSGNAHEAAYWVGAAGSVVAICMFRLSCGPVPRRSA